MASILLAVLGVAAFAIHSSQTGGQSCAGTGVGPVAGADLTIDMGDLADSQQPVTLVTGRTLALAGNTCGDWHFPTPSELLPLLRETKHHVQSQPADVSGEPAVDVRYQAIAQGRVAIPVGCGGGCHSVTVTVDVTAPMPGLGNAPGTGVLTIVGGPLSGVFNVKVDCGLLVAGGTIQSSLGFHFTAGGTAWIGGVTGIGLAVGGSRPADLASLDFTPALTASATPGVATHRYHTVDRSGSTLTVGLQGGSLTTTPIADYVGSPDVAETAALGWSC